MGQNSFRGMLLGLVVFFLTSCAFQMLHDHLQNAMGQNINVLVQRWGYPDGEREIMGHKVYIWGQTQNGYNYIPTVTQGNVGGVPYSAWSTAGTVVPVSHSCWIEITVNDLDDIIGYKVRGDQAGCMNYANALKGL